MLSQAQNNWLGQGVTGVRFMFTLGGGERSTPFEPPFGGVRFEWLRNPGVFLSDRRAQGIQRVTPTPMLYELWGVEPNSPFVVDRQVETCGVVMKLRFLRWLPFGLVDEDDSPGESWLPDRTCGNRSFYEAAQTPPDITGYILGTHSIYRFDAPGHGAHLGGRSTGSRDRLVSGSGLCGVYCAGSHGVRLSSAI